MNGKPKIHGVVVPMVTPVTSSGELDEAAVDKLVDFLVAGGVDGIFVVGTTGEGASVRPQVRRRLVERTAARVGGRTLVYAGTGEAAASAVVAGNEFFEAGADVVVSRPPISFPAEELDGLYQTLLDGLQGPLVIYNIPQTTNLSIPLEVIRKFIGHANLAGVKDSENNPARLEELMKTCGGRSDFSIFIGVGALMAHGMKLGADGIVPSVGNLIPEVCRKMCAAAREKNWAEVDHCAARMNNIAAVYQKGRTLGESLAALKGALACFGLCTRNVLPPLKMISESEFATVRQQLAALNLVMET
ncbi:MAG TPA: dihydrodipicolinate synthase family protein [Verrucomicrobiae bacterium]|nr:dihydrodipicolinate synthase family protein [Verrucomicrobiae bacterium]